MKPAILWSMRTEIRGVGRDEYFKKRDDEAAKGVKEYSPEDVAKIRADGLNKRAEMDARQREAFIRTDSAKTSNLKGWRMETISAGARFVLRGKRKCSTDKVERVRQQS